MVKRVIDTNEYCKKIENMNKIKLIVHIADIHIRTYQYHELYKIQFQEFIDELKTKTKDLNHNEIRIVIAGDLAHQKINISNEQLMLTSWFIDTLTKEIGPVIILPGNHDFLENNTERLDSITPIVELLNNNDVKYYKNSGVYSDENINWIVYSLYQHNERPIFEREEGKLHIGLFHGPIQGFSTDLGYVFEDAYEKINFHGCDIVLCGDIHKRSIQFLEKEIEIDEEDVDFYLEKGWKVK